MQEGTTLSVNFRNAQRTNYKRKFKFPNIHIRIEFHTCNTLCLWNYSCSRK